MNLKCYLKAVIFMTDGVLYVTGGRPCRFCATSESPPSLALSASVGLVFNYSPHCQVSEDLPRGAVMASETKATEHASVLT